MNVLRCPVYSLLQSLCVRASGTGQQGRAEGSAGTRDERTPTGGVVDISSLPPQPRALPSPRSAELRSRLAIAQG